jgi:hypothetical protein
MKGVPAVTAVDILNTDTSVMWIPSPNGEIQQTTGWAEYERRKRVFRAESPTASKADYDRFITELTAELGL